MPEPRFPTTRMCNGEILAAFEPTTRPSDVFVATAAKCGQTWLLALLHHLRTGGLDPDFGGRGAFAVTPWLEIPGNMTSGHRYEVGPRLAELEALPDPRVFKMHVTWPEIPRAAGSGAKIMTITRDPRDLPYSMYAHLQGMRPEVRGPSKADESFDTYFEAWMEMGYFFKVVRSFWPHHADPDVLWLRYEDLKADLAGQARRCVEFLGWDVSEEGLARACALASLGNMQSTESKLGMSDAFLPGSKFVREGAVGRNRARLSPEQQARIVARAREEFEPACFDFVMSQGT